MCLYQATPVPLPPTHVTCFSEVIVCSHQTLDNRILPENCFLPSEFEARIAALYQS